MIGESEPSEFRWHRHSILVFDPTGMSDYETRAGLISEMHVGADLAGEAIGVDSQVKDIEFQAASSQFVLKKRGDIFWVTGSRELAIAGHYNERSAVWREIDLVAQVIAESEIV